MALVVCPECGREKVSSSANACPGCGFNIANYYKAQEMREEETNASQEIPVTKEDRIPDENNHMEMINTISEDESPKEIEGVKKEGSNGVNSLFNYSSYDVRKMQGKQLCKVFKLIDDTYVKITNVWDEKLKIEDEISEEEKKRDKYAKKMGKGCWTFIWLVTITLTILIAIGTVGLGLLAGPVIFLITWFTTWYYFDMTNTPNKIEKKKEKYASQNIVPLQISLENLCEKEQKVLQSPELLWSVSILGNDMFYSGAASVLYNAVETGRADNYKEALAVFDASTYRTNMEQMQKEIQESAKNTQKIATVTAAAATTSAVVNYATYRKIKRR